MNCTTCKKAITGYPYASNAPGKLAWCSRECWGKESKQAGERAKKGAEIGWTPGQIRFGREA